MFFNSIAKRMILRQVQQKSYSVIVKKSMSSDFVALFQYVNNASRKMKNIRNKIKAANTKILSRRVNISS